MPGPRSWNGAKARHKRPLTNEAKRAQEQNVGRKFVKLSRPEPPSVAPVIQKSSRAPLAPDAKRVRALNKLLRQIEDLQERAAKGETLDEQQRAKVDRLDDVLREMEESLCAV